MTVLERKEIAGKDLKALAEGSVTAIRIKRYYPTDASQAIANKLMASKLHGKYENAPKIGRVGQAFFESQASEETAQRYQDDAVNWIRELRAGVFPMLAPIDRVRVELDEVWHHGATVATMNGRKMFVGLARTFSTGSYAEPHQDVFSWDAPESPEARRVISQIAMNVYLAMPHAGGELTLWNESFTQDEYMSKRIEGSYGLKREHLSAPVATLTPELGELILFNANKIHAVEKIADGTRVTWSAFIGYQGDDQPLALWS